MIEEVEVERRPTNQMTVKVAAETGIVEVEVEQRPVNQISDKVAAESGIVEVKVEERSVSQMEGKVAAEGGVVEVEVKERQVNPMTAKVEVGSAGVAAESGIVQTVHAVKNVGPVSEMVTAKVVGLDQKKGEVEVVMTPLGKSLRGEVDQGTRKNEVGEDEVKAKKVRRRRKGKKNLKTSGKIRKLKEENQKVLRNQVLTKITMMNLKISKRKIGMLF